MHVSLRAGGALPGLTLLFPVGLIIGCCNNFFWLVNGATNNTTSIPLGNVRPENIQAAGPSPGESSVVFVSQITYGGISSVNLATGEIQQVVPMRDFLERGALAVGYTGRAFVVAGGGPVPFGFRQTAVYVYDAETGQDIVTCAPLVGDEGFMNDVAFVGNKAYITDSITPNLMVLNVDRAVNDGVCEVDSLPLPAQDFNVSFPGSNGIAPYGDGLLIAVTSTGAVHFLDLGDNITAPLISPGGAPSVNGLFVQDGTLYVTQLNNVISVWSLSGGRNGKPAVAVREMEITSPLYRSASTSTVIGNRIFTTNLRLDLGLPAPGENDLSSFEEDFDIVVVTLEDDISSSPPSPSPTSSAGAVRSSPRRTYAVVTTLISGAIGKMLG